ncbi:2og-fe oxygenase family protein [Ophiostoma piceae UAMH 11346]|uniref:2og-fe oxygenase family protein n=1 Tax=Ophiostoma piceae (strain UAMH 11346) TaxID=1262450 RepID=S3C507_OPHP1|nr:2og-fe oxygenase family protein [Ophiostoma piceae UAMH 11346]
MDFLPPPLGPPPLLSPDALYHLCTHGYWDLDLPQNLAAQYDTLLKNIDSFFAEPLNAKLPYRPGVGQLGPPVNAGNTERGYTWLEGEKEYLTLRKSMTHLPPNIYDAAAPVWHDTARLLHRILGDISLYLGLPGGPLAWDRVVHDSLEPGSGVYDDTDPRNKKQVAGHPRDDPPSLLRLFRYEPGGGGAEQHRDLGLLTLCVCWGRGLQVSPRAVPGETQPVWVDAPKITVMTGDTLHVLSQYRIPSALHRVVVDTGEAAVEAQQAGGRRSIVFALRATTAGNIDLDAFGLPGSVSARELYDGIRRRRVNVNADKETREAMREAARSGSECSSSERGSIKGQSRERFDDAEGDLGGVA